MVGFILKRLSQMIFVLFIVSIFVFLLVQMIPGDVATAMLGERATTEDYEVLRESLGLNKPLYTRYLIWVGNLLKGDWGQSAISRYPVTQLFAQRLPNTIQLAFFSMFLSVIFSIPLGILAALKQNTSTDAIIRGFTTFGTSMPNFWLGMLLVMLFSLQWRLLPSSGVAASGEGAIEWLRHMLLPAVTIGLRFSSIVVRQTRAAFLEVLRNDYIRTARAKGVSEFWVKNKHALRNALIPVVTVVGLQFGRLIGGTVVTEMIFQIPGMGSLIADAVFSRDVPVVLGGVMIAAIGVVLINFAVDIIYGLIDPRIRYKRSGK